MAMFTTSSAKRTQIIGSTLKIWSYLYVDPLRTKRIRVIRVILSLEAPNYCLCIQSNSARFLFVNTGKQVHLKHARRHFERNLVKDVHHRIVASRLLSLGPIEGRSVQKYTPHNRTTQRRCTPRDWSRQHRHFGKSIPEFGETHSSVLGCERRSVSASIMSRSCFASFPVCVYKFSSHYFISILFCTQ